MVKFQNIIAWHDLYEMFIDNTVLDTKLHFVVIYITMGWHYLVTSIFCEGKNCHLIFCPFFTDNFFCIWRWWCFSISHHNESNECPFIHTNEHTHKQLSTSYMLLAHHENSLLSAISYVYFAPSNTLWREWSFKPPNCLKGK